MGKAAFHILIGGEAGQGLVTVGQLLTRALVRCGFNVIVTQSYQSRIRGGHNSFSIRYSAGKIDAPQEAVDLLVALDQATVPLHRDALRDDGLLLLDESLDPDGLPGIKAPFRRLAEEGFANMAALGAAACLLGLEEDLVARTADDMFGDREPEAARENRRALKRACSWAAGLDRRPAGPPPPTDSPRRLMMNGNEAIALGALSAGLKFCAFYPMTPSTSIALALTGRAERMGLVVEQAEDEIAAVNMAIGASFAGAPSMVPTSGGGFALMAEGVSLSAMTETPLVIVIAQRPGPATGLPTRTEQGDLEFVLHAGHGEFPRVIFTPGTVEECFHLTRRAFDTAERSQGPVFILTDQFLADSYRAVEPFDVQGLSPAKAGSTAREGAAPYRRYSLTADGVSARLLPGLSGHLVVADSDEHTEDGHLTEDLTVRRLMVEKRMKKYDGILADVIPPTRDGDSEPDMLFVSWGSSRGAADEAAGQLRAEGQRAATLHFSQVWPMVPGQFLGLLQSAGRVIGVEGNATGQLSRLIRRETGFEIKEKVCRFDGLPLTPEFILSGLKPDYT